MGGYVMNRIGILLLIIFAVSCNVNQQPISYGSDGCDYCKMTIMDHRYGAELVSEKGKVYTFDAAECLIEYLYHNEGLNQSSNLFLVTSYTSPDTLIDARNAVYLVSKEMPSPMGAFLTSFHEPEIAAGYQQKHGGNLYQWDELFANFRSIKREVINQ
jgi:copper chaperone NosL